MTAVLSRQFLKPYGTKDLFVVRFKAPTYPKTRGGEPVYVERQVRFWSLCSNETKTTNVIRCVPDDESSINSNGYTTFVVSAPGSKPAPSALKKYSARWVPWGALAAPEDVVYDAGQQPWGIGTYTHYYSTLMYRQTLANSSFLQSMANVSQLPANEQKTAMGPYWPVSGYCTKADFEGYGMSCITR